MSDTPWTPGPWEIRDESQGPNEEFWGSPIYVGPALVFDGEWYGRESGNAAADARLIAAAPEMAALLEEMAAFATGNGHVWTDRAAALLARIRGEA